MKTILEQANERFEKARRAVDEMNEVGALLNTLGDKISAGDKGKAGEWREATDDYFEKRVKVLSEVRKLAEMLGVNDVKKKIRYGTPAPTLVRIYRNFCWQWAPIEACLLQIANKFNGEEK